MKKIYFPILFLFLIQLNYSKEYYYKTFILCKTESQCLIHLSFPKNISKDRIKLPNNFKCDSKYYCSFQVKKPEIYTIEIGKNKQNLYIINYRIENMKSEKIKITLKIPKKINNLLYKVKINKEEKLFSNKLNNRKFLILNKHELTEKLNILIEENNTITSLYLSILNKNIIKLRLLDDTTISLEKINKIWFQNNDNQEIILTYNIQPENVKSIKFDPELTEIEIIDSDIDNMNLKITLYKDTIQNKIGIYKIIYVLNDEKKEIISDKKIILSNYPEPNKDLFEIDHPILILSNDESQNVIFKLKDSSLSYENLKIKCGDNNSDFQNNGWNFEITGNGNNEIKNCILYLDDENEKLIELDSIYIFKQITDFITIKTDMTEKNCFYVNEINNNEKEYFTIEKINENDNQNNLFKEYIKNYVFNINNEINYKTSDIDFPFKFKTNDIIELNKTLKSIILKDKEENGIKLYTNYNTIKITDINTPNYGYYYNNFVKIELNQLFCELSGIIISKDSLITQKECKKEQFYESNNTLSINCSLESNELIGKYGIYVNNINTEKTIILSRDLNESEMNFKVEYNEIELNIGEEITIELTSFYENEIFDYNQVKKIVISYKNEDKEDIITFTNSNISIVDNSKITFKLKPNSIYDIYTISYLSDNDSINKKICSNITNKEIKFKNTFKLEKIYYYFIENPESQNLIIKLKCIDNDGATNINSSLTISNDSITRNINDDIIELNGQFSDAADLLITYRKQEFHIYIIKINSFEKCFESEEYEEIEFKFSLPGIDDKLNVKYNDSSCENKKCKLEINEYEYKIYVNYDGEDEEEIGTISIKEKNSAEIINKYDLFNEKNQKIIFSVNNNFDYNNENHIFSLLKYDDDNSNSESISLSCEQNNEKNMICDNTNLLNKDEGEYNIILNDKTKCGIDTIITNITINTLSISSINDFLIEKGNSTLILNFDFSFEKNVISSVTLTKIDNEEIKITSSIINVEDNNNNKNNKYIIEFDLSNEDNKNIVAQNKFKLKYIIFENEKEYSDEIEIKEACTIPKISDGNGNCKNCYEINSINRYFDYDKKDSIQNERCVENCINSYILNDICYSDCTNANTNENTYKNPSDFQKNCDFNVTIIDIKSNSSNIVNIEEQSINFTFSQNLPFSQLIFNISVILENEIEGKCDLEDIRKTDEITCIFNFSFITEDKDNIPIKFTINDTEYNENNIKINITTTNDTCKLINKYYLNKNNKGSCVEKCEINYGILPSYDTNECVLCNNGRISINSKCLINYTVENIQPSVLKPFNSITLNITFNIELNEEDIEYVSLIQDDNKINSTSCSLLDNSKTILNCIFDLENSIKGEYNLTIKPNEYDEELNTEKKVNILEKLKCDEENKILDEEEYECELCSEIDSANPFYQNGTCVSECDEKNNYGISLGNEKLCIICNDNGFILSNGTCNCPDYLVYNNNKCLSCSENDTSKSYLYVTNNTCYNECPDDTYLLKNKKLCFDNCSSYSSIFINDETSKKCIKSISCPIDYCENNGTCTLNGNNISCICNDNFTGVKCNIDLNENDIEIKINEIINKIKDETNDKNNITDLLNNNELIYAIKELGVFLKDTRKINKNKNSTKIFYEKSKKGLSLITSLVTSVYDSTYNSYNSENLLPFIGLSIFYQVNILFSLKNIRQLDESENEIAINEEKLNNIISSTFEYYSTEIQKQNDTLIEHPFYYITSDDNMLNIIIVSNSKNNYLKYVVYCKEKIIPFISIPYNELVETDDYTELYLQISLSSDVNLALNYETPSKKVMIGRFLVSRKDDAILTIKKISSPNSIVNLPLNTESDSKFNLNLFKYFFKKGVNIYNKNDEAFQDRCFRNEKLKIDYPQKYRRQSLYQNYTITGTTSNCYYLGYENNIEYIQLYCIDIENVGYYLLKDEFTKKEIEQSKRLPFRCSNKFKDYKKNLALWIFTGISFLLILSIILSFVNYEFDYDDLSTSLKNDKILNEGFIKIPEKSFQSKIEGLDQTNINKIEDNSLKESCFKIFCENLLYVHPLFCLFQISLIQPKMINFAIFFNSLANLLGWNAFYYTEKMFERRIIKKHRENFCYPMKYEFDKIICSIATTVGINLVIRLITLTSYLEKTNIEQKMRDKTEEEKMHIAKEYKSSILIRNIIGIILVFFLVGYFFYYCVIFCYVYVNTQKSWLFSVIWSLIWNWVIFSPILIILISLSEKSGSDACAHYMKQLFLF